MKVGRALMLALIASLVCPAVAAGQSQGSIVVQPPTGWFGVVISDDMALDDRGNAFFDSYPVVTKVEPGSPAAKAGVLAGDVLLSFNSHDMRGGSLQIKNWLKPGAPFVLQLRRNDGTRTVRGTLGRRPENWEEVAVATVSPAKRIELRTRSFGHEELPPMPMRIGTRMDVALPRMPAPARLPSVLVPALGFGVGIYPFAGAEFTSLNSDLCEVLGVKPEGVFVTNVLEGSPARLAGLRGGDVVVMADSIKIENPIDLVRAIRAANDGSLRMQIIRKHKPQTLDLRW